MVVKLVTFFTVEKQMRTVDITAWVAIEIMILPMVPMMFATIVSVPVIIISCIP